MYQNLRAEIARNGTNLSRLSAKVGMSLQSLSAKINCKDKRGFLFSEAVSIKKALGVDMPLEQLFEREP